jgi:hypothetical protein
VYFGQLPWPAGRNIRPVPVDTRISTAPVQILEDELLGGALPDAPSVCMSRMPTFFLVVQYTAECETAGIAESGEAPVPGIEPTTVVSGRVGPPADRALPAGDALHTSGTPCPGGLRVSFARPRDKAFLRHTRRAVRHEYRTITLAAHAGLSASIW